MKSDGTTEVTLLHHEGDMFVEFNKSQRFVEGLFL